MSSANRPTFNPAKATETQGGFKRYVPSHTQSMYLLPAHTVLKTRQIGQNSIEEVKQKDLKKELEDREKELKKKNTLQSLKQDQEEPEDKLLSIQDEKKEKEDSNSDEEKDSNPKKRKSKYDDEDEDLDSSSSDDSDDSDNSDDEELMKELARIKKESAEKEKKELQQRALTSNPLLQPINVQQQDEESFTVKRKWTDSTVFKNQAREEKQQKKKRFINDTTRNDYHKEFMNEFMK